MTRLRFGFIGAALVLVTWMLLPVQAQNYLCGQLNGAPFCSAMIVGHLSAGGPAPTCSTNCGASPTVAGGDSAGIVTFGAGAASGWVLTFASTWGVAPSCVVSPAKSDMAGTKLPLAVVTTAATMTVITNSAAPDAADLYAYHCVGVQ